MHIDSPSEKYVYVFLSYCLFFLLSCCEKIKNCNRPGHVRVPSNEKRKENIEKNQWPDSEGAAKESFDQTVVPEGKEG